MISEKKLRFVGSSGSSNTGKKRINRLRLRSKFGEIEELAGENVSRSRVAFTTRTLHFKHQTVARQNSGSSPPTLKNLRRFLLKPRQKWSLKQAG
jgi:hypothetical protein